MDRPIAIVGIGARLPGGRGPAGVWRMLARHEAEIGTAPDSRARFLTEHDIPDADFAAVCRTGGFIDGWDEFDHPAFGISAREAEVMDPQQRILLETAFEAIGDAGFTLDYLQRRTTGVVSGCITRDYWLSARHDAGLDAMSNVGNTGSGLSGRLSHVFGLTGPSITLDSACSSGLAAVGTAIDNILAGNCSVAIAAATNLVLDPYETLSFHRSGMLAADGRCKFGTTRADGFVRSDGFVAVVLRPLEDALAEHDRVYAVIEAVATGNDAGRSGSLVTPSVDGQVEVIRRALALAGRAPAEVDYVEAHGTGTTVGDQVELDGLATVFADRSNPLPVGSVKTRIGHCEATSGLAGLVVAALSLQNATVPPMLAHGELRTELSGAERGLFAHVDASLPLPDDAVIGVSSFGITGTNAHAILASPPRPQGGVPGPRPSLPRLTSAGVAPSAADDADDRDGADSVDAALAYRVNHTTGQRQAGVAAEGAVTTLGTGLIAGLWREAPKVVFAFGGFGAHWLDPATVTDTILRTHLHTAYTAVRDRLPEGEQHLLDGGDAVPAALQPYATWASQLAIAFTLRDYGVRPDAVLGHSFGDIAAACVAGALDLEAAADLLVARTEAVRAHSGNTRMIVITGEDVARDRAWIPPSADVAVVNSPSCVVLACPDDALDTVTELAVAQGHEARVLEVVFGSHSRFVEPAIPAFTPVATAIGRDRTADVPFYSSTTTVAAVAQTVMAPRHWLDNLRVPVELPPVAARLADDGYGIIVDIGPRAVLAGHLRAQFTGTVLATDALDGDDFLRATIGSLFAANVPLRPDRLPPWTSEFATALTPKLTPRAVTPLRPAGRASAPSRPTVTEAAESVTYRLSGPPLRVLAGHQVNGETVVPGTLTLSYIVHTLRQAGEALRLDTVRFVEAIVIDDDTDHLALTVTRAGTHVEVHFTTDPAVAPVLCCTATVAPAGSPAATIDLPLNLSPLPVDAFYRDFAAAGNLWDGPFRSIGELWASISHAYVSAELGEPLSIGGEIDPALFDAALHGLAAVHYGLVGGAEPHCPFYFEGVDRMTFHQHRLRGRVRSIIAPSAAGTGFDIAVLDAEDRIAIRCEGVRIRPLENRSAIPALHRVWVPLTRGIAIGSGDHRVFDLFDSPLGAGVRAAADPRTADLDVAESLCAELVAATGADRELLIDARTSAECPAATMTDYLAGLGLVVTRLAHTAAEAGVPLGIVVADIEHPPAGEFAAAVTGFLFSLAGSLPAEIPSLAVAVVSAAAGDPLGELPSIRELSERGEHRVRRDGSGALWAARLTDRPQRSRPPYSHPAERHLDRWSAEVRLHSTRTCDLELVWSDPNRGPRGIGIRPLPGRYRQAQRLPDILWAANAAQQIVAVARLGADDGLVVSGDSGRAALLRAAIETLTATHPGTTRRIGISLSEPGVHESFGTDVDLLITSAEDSGLAADRTTLTLPELAPASAWPRSLVYRPAPAEIETTLLDLADRDLERPEADRAPERTARRRAALIAGGNGGLGSALAADLAARSFEEIILVGTRENPGVEAPFDYLRCDIGEASAVELLQERMSRVKADDLYVFHLAGRLSAGPFTDLERADWIRVLGPKVDGTRNLVEAADRAGAHMLVAYSSASAVLASPQFAHYGAANAALEGILTAAADRVRVRGVRWGFWAGAGMLRDLDPTRSFTPAGVQEIGAAEGHAFLWNAMATPGTDFPVCYPADWAEFGGRYDVLRRDALLHELRPAAVGEIPSPPVESAPPGSAEQVTPLESLIMDTLKISDVAVVRSADRLRAIGLDSLLAVELRTKIKSAFGHTVPMRTLLGPITTEKLHALVTDAESRSA